jgi:hypothetical protein
MEELIKFCEERNLGELAAGLRQDLLSSQSATKQSKEQRALQIIRKAVKLNEAKRDKEEVQNA